jgi:hypothetical protein
MCIPPQVNGQPEGHREDIPPPVRGVAGPGRVQDPHHFDVAYQSVVDYRPQPPVGVSIPRLSATSLLLINDIRATEPCICLPR